MGEGTGSFVKRRNKTPRNKASFLNPDSLDSENSDKKRKKVARNKKKESAKIHEDEAETTEIASPDEVYNGKVSAGMSDKKKKKMKIKRRNKESTKEDGVCDDNSNQQSDSLDSENSDKKRKKVARNKKRESAKIHEAETAEIVVSASPDDVYDGKVSAGMNDKKTKKMKIKRRNKESTKEDDVCDDSNQQSDNPDGANSVEKRKRIARKKKRDIAELPEAETTETVSRDDVCEEEGKNSSAGMSSKKKKKLKKKKRDKENTKVDEVGDDSNQQTLAKSGKSEGASQLKNDTSLLDEDEVYQISSGDEDETTGMKRWIAEYHRARPGAEVLLQRIDDFLVDYWEQKEKETKEREAEAAEGGWTVVKHIKGRKKTTDGESGTTMGSVAQAAVIDKMSKKKKDKQHVVGLNFYRFQRREAQRNEIMMLQSKFEQDKKRIQQMRTARKFRPY